MKIEHFALQVADPVAMARWYVVHLGMTIQRGSKQPPFAHFLADDGGQMLIEIYHNEQFDVPDQSAVPPAHFHLAFVSDDIESDRTRLIEAGAKAEGPINTQPNGDLVCFLRDPWGLTLQLVTRVEKLLT
ncbi:VOC family protein [Bremerella sp. JC817]|uniref:VOC family protein n=1 Tax=Bremerella sp. JC817 TaxID=3231756 RepID=UPI00345A3728